ncbi:hypothetical protein OCA22_24825 [Bacillus cereus]|nr:hypothetical protein [Bacillus cereus]
MFSLEQLNELKKSNKGNEIAEELIADIEVLHKRLKYAHRFAKRDDCYDAPYVEETLSEMDGEGIEFSEERMKKLAKEDAFIKSQVERLSLEIVFNAYVLGDLNMERIYKSL